MIDFHATPVRGHRRNIERYCRLLATELTDLERQYLHTDSTRGPIEIAKANPGVAVGNYPFFDPQHGPNTNVVLRARDAQKLVQVKHAVEDMLERVRRAQSKSA